MNLQALRNSETAQEAPVVRRPCIVNCRPLLRAGHMHLFLFKSPDSEWNEDNRLTVLKPANSA